MNNSLKQRKIEEDEELSPGRNTKTITTSIHLLKDMLHNFVENHGLVVRKNHVLKEKVHVSIHMKLINTQIFTVKMVFGAKREKVVHDMVQVSMLMVLNSLEH